MATSLNLRIHLNFNQYLDLRSKVVVFGILYSGFFFYGVISALSGFLSLSAMLNLGLMGAPLLWRDERVKQGLRGLIASKVIELQEKQSTLIQRMTKTMSTFFPSSPNFVLLIVVAIISFKLLSTFAVMPPQSHK